MTLKTLKTLTVTLACVVFVTACGGNGNESSRTGADSAASPASPDTPADSGKLTDTTDVPASVPASRLLMGSETIYAMKSGAAYHYWTVFQGAPGPDGFRVVTSTLADENGPREPISAYTLTRNGWTFKPKASSWKLDDDGAMLTMRNDDNGSLTQSRYKEIDVSGKPVLSYIADYFQYRQQDLVRLQGAVFPQGSRIGLISGWKEMNDQYQVSSYLYSYQLSSKLRPSSIAGLLENASASDPVCVGVNRQSALLFAGYPGQKSGSVMAYEAKANGDQACMISGALRDTGLWELRSVSGASILVLTFPGLTSADLVPTSGGSYGAGDGKFITYNEIDGKVVEGRFMPADPDLPAETEKPDEYLLNQTAWGYVKTRLPLK
jgi:hypothetical protein